MLRTPRLITSGAIAIAALLMLSACSTADWPSTWANETASDVCGFSSRNVNPLSAVGTYEGETVLVTGTGWADSNVADLGLTWVNGKEAVDGLDPLTGTFPDKILCVRSLRTTEVECPDGRSINEPSLKLETSLHSIALASEIGSTEVHASQQCRAGAADGDVALASDTSGSDAFIDIYDIDQVFCDLLACVLDDDIAATLTGQRADDPRSEVCEFNDPFIDGILELEDGPVYVVHELGYQDSMTDTTPAFDVMTERTLCISAESDPTQEVSCGEYYFEDQPYSSIEVSRRGVAVTASWFEGDATTATASTSSVYYSDCSEEISVRTTTYGSTTIGSTGLEDRTESSTLTTEHVLWVAEDLQQWAEISTAAPDLSANDCSALTHVDQLSVLQRRLDGYDDGLSALTIESPAGLTHDIEKLQEVTSDLFDNIDDDSPLFDPVFELWYIAYFNWPLIDTFVDPSDPDATEEDYELTLMGMPARVGAVSIAEPTFTTRHETVELLAQIYTDHC